MNKFIKYAFVTLVAILASPFITACSSSTPRPPNEVLEKVTKDLVVAMNNAPYMFKREVTNVKITSFVPEKAIEQPCSDGITRKVTPAHLVATVSYTDKSNMFGMSNFAGTMDCPLFYWQDANGALQFDPVIYYAKTNFEKVK